MGRKEQPKSPQSPPPEGIRRWVKLVIGVVCLVSGLGLLWPMSVKPLQAYSALQVWRTVPCEVVDRRVEGPTVRVRYQYEIGGTIFRSDRLRPLEFGEYVGVDQRFEQYLPGSRQTCYVDPVNPTMAVLDRSLGRKWLSVLVPVPLLVIGVIGVRSRWGNRRRRALFDER